jgi:hypothetical protein
MKSFIAAALVLTVFVGPALAANQSGHGTNGNSGNGVSGSTGNQGNGGATGNAGGFSGGQGGSTGGSTGSGAGAPSGGGSNGSGAGAPGGASGDAGTSGSSAGASGGTSGGASSGNTGGAGAGSSGTAGSGFSLTLFSGKAPAGVRVAGKTFTIAPTRTLTAHQVMTWTVFQHCADPAVRLIALYPDGGFRFMNYDHLSNLPVWRTAECMTAYGYEFQGMAFGGKTNFVGQPLDLGPQN